MYEGRTRGKRIKYTYSDDEDAFFSDSTGYRRSARNTGTNTPAETGPTTTASGRQIRAPPRLNMVGGDDAPGSLQGDTAEFEHEGSVGPSGRPRRAAATGQEINGWSGSRSRRSAGTEEESEAEFGDDEEDADAHVPEDSDEEDEFEEEEAMVEDDLDDQPQSLVVKLSITPPKLRTALTPTDHAANMLPTPDAQDWKAETTVPDIPVVEMDDAPDFGPTPAAEKPPISPGALAAPADVVNTSTLLNAHSQPETPNNPTPHAVSTTPDKSFSGQEASANAIPETSLAFRGSPEKPHAQLASPSVGLSGSTS